MTLRSVHVKVVTGLVLEESKVKSVDQSIYQCMNANKINELPIKQCVVFYQHIKT